jgi:hypothetical protein
MRRLLNLACALTPLLLAASYSRAAEDTEYDRQVISVVTLSRHASLPTANCLVWANAEDLGVGPAQLDGMHGVSMNINPQPLPSEAVKPTPFAEGLADIKTRFPKAPAWLLATIEKNRTAIEAACAQDHPIPFKVYTITQRDKR